MFLRFSIEERYKGIKIHCDAQITPRFIKKYCELTGTTGKRIPNQILRPGIFGPLERA